ncbi:hypothetical protein R3P38DRAFT_2785789 [Favolaschia claudopus]|uniref:Uncharacterized protein n=1 Tax=Favolaschia claudopus TaxID=2862362 RepID=A0AAW0ATB1_9AGAR
MRAVLSSYLGYWGLTTLFASCLPGYRGYLPYMVMQVFSPQLYQPKHITTYGRIPENNLIWCLPSNQPNIGLFPTASSKKSGVSKVGNLKKIPFSGLKTLWLDESNYD